MNLRSQTKKLNFPPVSQNLNQNSHIVSRVYFPPNSNNLDDNMTESKLDINMALKIIPEFSGNRSEFHKFVSCCDIMSTSLTSDADKALLAKIIITKLSGPAYHLIKYKSVTKWADLKVLLQEQFLESRSIAQLQLELLNCRQGNNESVRDFANKIEQLLNDLNDACIASQGPESATLIQNLNQKSAYQAFTQGLNYQYKVLIKASRFTTLTEAISAAVEEERLNNVLGHKKTENKSTGRSKCHFCSKLGHLEKDCFIKRNQTQGAHAQIPSIPYKREIKQETTVNTITCAYCKKPGHHIRECYKKKRADEFKRQQPRVNTVETDSNSNSGNLMATAGALGNPSRPHY